MTNTTAQVRPDLLAAFDSRVEWARTVPFDYGQSFGLEVLTREGRRLNVRFQPGGEPGAVEVLKARLDD